MSWRVALGSQFNLIRFYVCEPAKVVSAGSLDLLKRQPYDASEGLRTMLKRERSEWLMLNQGLPIPVTFHHFRHNYPARLEFYTKDFHKGELNCQGLAYDEVEDKMRIFVEALRDCKPQNVVELEYLKNESPHRGLLRYLAKKSNIKDFSVDANY